MLLNYYMLLLNIQLMHLWINFQHLMYVDLNKDTKSPIADVYSDPHIKGEMRTDLHPRFNETCDLISFDANIRGNRNLYIIHLNK